MLNPRLTTLITTALLLLCGSLGTVGCTTSKPVKGSEERPDGPQVAQEAGAAADTPDDDLVLYSSSMEKADLEAGADEADEEIMVEQQAEQQAPQVPSPLEVSVEADGSYTLGGQTYTEVPKLVDALDKLYAKQPTSTVSIRATADTPDNAIVDLIAAARRAGFTNMEVRVRGNEPESSE